MFLKLNKENILRNTYVIHPSLSWFLSDGKIYYNRNYPIAGEYGNVINHYELDTSRPNDRPESLDEYNVDRDAASHTINDPTLIYPFCVNKGDGYYPQNVSTSDSYAIAIGDTIVGEYPLLSNLALQLYPSTDTTRRRIKSLHKVVDKYKIYNANIDFGTVDTENVRLISVPEIFYGSKIQPGTVKLDFYKVNRAASSDLVGSLEDLNGDGLLYQTNGIDPTHDGDMAGYVLYDEGFILIFGDFEITNAFSDKFKVELGDLGNYTPRWWYFGASWYSALCTSNFEVTFKGTNSVNNITMLCECDGLNYSNNPSFLTGTRNVEINSDGFYEDINDIEVCNTVYSQYETEAPYKPQVFITKIGIYDGERRLIGVAKTSQPIKVDRSRRILFKVSLDI